MESPNHLEDCAAVDLKAETFSNEVFSKVQEASGWFFFSPKGREKAHCHCTCGTHSSNKVDRTGHSAPRLRALVNHKLPGDSDCIFSSTSQKAKACTFSMGANEVLRTFSFFKWLQFSFSTKCSKAHLVDVFFLTSGGLMGIGDEKRCEKHKNTLEPAGCFWRHRCSATSPSAVPRATRHSVPPSTARMDFLGDQNGCCYGGNKAQNICSLIGTGRSSLQLHAVQSGGGFKWETRGITGEPSEQRNPSASEVTIQPQVGGKAPLQSADGRNDLGKESLYIKASELATCNILQFDSQTWHESSLLHIYIYMCTYIYIYISRAYIQCIMNICLTWGVFLA